MDAKELNARAVALIERIEPAIEGERELMVQFAMAGSLLTSLQRDTGVTPPRQTRELVEALRNFIVMVQDHAWALVEH